MRAIERIHAGAGNRNRTGGWPTKTDTERWLNALVPDGKLMTNGKPLRFFGHWLRKNFPDRFDRVHRKMAGLE